jgi:hypothetical protein
MANEFYIATDIKVEAYLPFGGTFGYRGIWNLTQWDNASWASNSTDGMEWKDLVATVASATITHGGPVESGYYAPAAPNTLSVTMQSAIYDPFSPSSGLRAGTAIRFSYRPNPDTAPSTWVILFQGYVDSFDVSYEPNGLNSIQVEASSSLKRYLNKNLSVFNNSSKNLYDIYAQWATATGANIGSGWSIRDMYDYAIQYQVDVSAGDVLDQLNQVENGIIWQVPETDVVAAYSATYFRNLLLTTPFNVFDNVHTTAANHYCITEIGFTYDSDAVYNKFVITSINAPTTNVTKTDQDLVDLYGEMRLEKELVLDTTTEVTAWLAKISAKNPSRRVKMVTTSAIRPDRKLAELGNLQPADVVAVQVNQPTYTVNEKAIITSATHEITPEGWLVTLELWKGL